MISIFIEGKEKGFLETFLNHIGKSEMIASISFESTGGWTNLSNLDNKLIDNHRSGFKNIIIFDADNSQNGGGFTKRKKEIELLLNELHIDFKIFLFPNNETDGDFELLLENIINSEHSGLLDCFDKYEVCLSQYKTKEGASKYVMPNRKAKIYSYITAFPRSRKELEKLKNKGDWSFENKNYWNLDNEILNNLKSFLLEEIK